MSGKEERLMGKTSGAVRRADGSLRLAPMYAVPYQRLLDRERALALLVEQHNRFINDEYARIVADHRELAQRIRHDHDLPEEPLYRSEIKNGELIWTPAPDDKAGE